MWRLRGQVRLQTRQGIRNISVFFTRKKCMRPLALLAPNQPIGKPKPDMKNKAILLAALALAGCASTPDRATAPNNPAPPQMPIENPSQPPAPPGKHPLISDDPTWPEVQKWIAEATNRVEILPANKETRLSALEETRVTTRSPMGAVIYETGGLLIDGGWIRILGSGHARLPRSLPAWNKQFFWKDSNASPQLLIVADDALGGSFALNGGKLAGDLHKIHYFAPDSLAWESTGLSYSAFLNWALAGDLETFYKDQRWPNWQRDVATLPGDQGYSIYPYLWAKGPPLAERSKRAISIKELVEFQFDMQKQLEGTKDGEQVEVISK
jgi:hypothetical protein